MPKRILDDSLLDSRSLEVLSPGAQDAFPRFILLADDFGCFEVNPVILRARGWSRRPEVTETMVEGWITEYAERQACDPDGGARLAPVLMLWSHVGRRYAYLTGWHGPHGQKRRDEYGPSKPHGSKRKTPPPPGDLLAAVLAGNVRAIDGKPPGTDREPTGNEETEKARDSVPARDFTGSLPGNSRDGAGENVVPAPAVPVPVAVPVAKKKPAPAAPSPSNFGSFRGAQVALAAVFLEVRGGKYLWQGAKDTEGLKRILALGVPLSEILDRWRSGLNGKGWASVANVAQLAAKWNDLSAGGDPYEAGMRRVREQAERELDRPGPGDGGVPGPPREDPETRGPIPAFGASLSSAVGELLGGRGAAGRIQDGVPLEPGAQPRGAQAPRPVREP